MHTRRAQAGALTAIFFVVIFSPYSVLVADDATQPARAALSALESWLKNQSTGPGWTEYLKLSVLDAELAKGNDANAQVISDAVKQLDSGVKGLELKPFADLRQALAPLPQELIVAKAPNLAEAAKGLQGSFRPVSDVELSNAKTDLEKAVTTLNRYLGSLGKNGANWKEFLRWSDLESQLKAATGDGDALSAIKQRFESDQNGLELPVFANVKKALHRYANLLAARAEGVPASFAERLNGLADKLRNYEDPQHQSQDAADEIGSELGWLEDMQQVAPLVAAVRARFSKPNVDVNISTHFVAAGVAQSVDETGPITDNILGTAISGTAHTVGNIEAGLVPSDDYAMIDTRLTGTTNTQTVGYNGPATIHSRATTKIAGSKRIVFNADGFASYPATASATTSTQITGVSAGGNIAQRVANDRVYESKPQAEQIAASHAAARVRQRMDKQSNEQLSKSQANYLQKVRNPLVRRDEFPPLLACRTTETAMFIKGLQADRYQLGAASERAPALGEGHDVILRAHESALNNLATAMLSGTTLKEEEVQEQVKEWRGELPEKFKTEEDREPWSITLSRSKPVSVKIGENSLQITIRGQRFKRNNVAMNITADYKIVGTGADAKLVRQGELQIFPPRFAPGVTLSVNELKMKKPLQRQFNKLLEAELKLEPIKLTGQLEKAGPLNLAEMRSAAGWIAVGLRAAAKPDAAATAAK